MAPNAVASVKELVEQAPRRTLVEQLAAERDHFLDNLFRANGGEGSQRLPREARAALFLSGRARDAVTSETAVHPPVLTIDEQSNIESGSWFSRLSPPLREAILSRAVCGVLADGAILSARGARPRSGAASPSARCG